MNQELPVGGAFYRNEKGYLNINGIIFNKEMQDMFYDTYIETQKSLNLIENCKYYFILRSKIIKGTYIGKQDIISYRKKHLPRWSYHNRIYEFENYRIYIDDFYINANDILFYSEIKKEL